MDYEEAKEERRKRREAARERNLEWLQQSGLPYELRNDGVIALIRISGKPHCDVYLTTNKWRSFSTPGGKTHYGDVSKFLQWLEHQVAPPEPQKYTNWQTVVEEAKKSGKAIKAHDGGWILK